MGLISTKETLAPASAAGRARDMAWTPARDR
jgi:hypothetical protein